MIAGLKPYPEMRDSGVVWLGGVPTHWQVKPLKHWLGINQRTLTETSDPEFAFDYLSISNVGTGRLLGTPERLTFGASPSRARRLVQPGDTVFSMVRPYLRAIYHVDEVPFPLVCSTGFAVLSPPREASSKFVSYLTQSATFLEAVSKEAVGVAYPAIAEGQLGAVKVAVPSFEEQAAIVRFLDHADRRIRRSIAAKQKMIRLLEEQKAAMVHQAVTRGANPRALMKRSGVDWLGDIPAHWAVDRLKHSFREVDVRSATGAEELLSVSHKTGVTARSEKNISMFKAETNVGHKVCEVGDFCANTMWLWMGAIGIAKRRGLISPAYAVYRLRGTKDFLPDYVDMFIRLPPLVAEYYRRSKGITKSRLRLYPESFLDIVVARPPLEEQAQILSHIAEATTEIDRAHSVAQSEIALLNEYRTRLVTDVITGKLDVRAAAVGLPDDPLDEPQEAYDTLEGEDLGDVDFDAEEALEEA